MDTNNNNDVDQPTFTGIDEALDYYEQKDSDSVATTTDDEEKEEKDEEETKEVEATEDEPESEESDEEEPDDEDESEEDSEDEDEEEKDYLFKFTDGEEEIIVKNLEEAKKGYLRQRDYTKKSQEVAATKKQLDEASSDLLGVKKEYLEGVAQVKAMASTQLAKFVNVDWETLHKDDPLQFDDLKGEFEAAKLSYEQAQTKEREEKSSFDEETQKYVAQIREEEFVKLKEAVPEVAEQGSEYLTKVTEYAMDAYGFEQGELTSILDSRQVMALIDAYKYNESNSKIKSGKVKAKAIQSIKPKGTKSKRSAKAQKAKAKQDTLNKPGGITLDQAKQMFS